MNNVGIGRRLPGGRERENERDRKSKKLFFRKL